MFRIALAIASLTLVLPSHAGDIVPGTPNRAVKGAGGCSYAIYVPKKYNKRKKWPVLLCFHPGGHGYNFVAQSWRAAERFGWIIAGSNDSKGSDIAEGKVVAMYLDVAKRFSVHPGRVYTGGFDGGSHVACIFAGKWKSRGVIAVGGTCTEASALPGVRMFLTCKQGDRFEDEMKTAQETLEGKGLAVKLKLFKGKSRFASRATFAEAIGWHQKQWKSSASKELAEASKAMAGLSDTVERYWKARDLARTYDGVKGLKTVTAAINKLEKDPAVQKEAAAMEAYESLAAAEASATEAKAMRSLAEKCGQFATRHEGTRAATRATAKAKELSERADSID